MEKHADTTRDRRESDGNTHPVCVLNVNRAITERTPEASSTFLPSSKMRRMVVKRLALVGTFALLTLAYPSTASAQRCDRQCLSDFITRYLNAMIAHDPERLMRSSRVRFTEDAVEMKLGEGLWKTITGLRPYRQDFIDVRQGIAGTHTVVEEDGMPVLLALRLKVFGLALSEVETMVVRNRQEGILFQPDAFKAPNPGMAYVPKKSELNTRDEMTRIASLYPAGLRAGSFLNPDVPMSDDAYRFENGQKMAGPGCTFRPPSCENMKAQAVPKLAGLTYRVVAVDEEMGVVWLWQDFGPGSVPGGKGDTMISTFEAFKVYGGKIHAAEAILESAPVGRKSGWDTRAAN
jgi:hypothetical protein